MQEYIPENQLLANQLAKRALLSLGKEPDNQTLYSLQLMREGLELPEIKGGMSYHNRTKTSIQLDSLLLLDKQGQSNLWKWMSQDNERIPGGEQLPKNPLDLVEWFLVTLLERIDEEQNAMAEELIPS